MTDSELKKKRDVTAGALDSAMSRDGVAALVVVIDDKGSAHSHWTGNIMELSFMLKTAELGLARMMSEDQIYNRARK